MKFQDYYEVLKVPRTATGDEIKAAYRSLAMKSHPDLAKGNKKTAEENFKRINEANEVLSDAEKRKKYDAFGENWQHGQEFTPPPQGAGGGAGARRMSPEEFASMFGGGGFSDFFATHFGEDLARNLKGGAKAGRHARFRHRGADVRAELRLTVGDAIRGGNSTFSVAGRAACPRCGGVGFVGEHVCPSCAGLGQTEKPKTVEVSMPKDLRDGSTLRLRGLGESGEEGAEAGDLYLEIRLDSDDVYRIRGDDLEADVPMTPWETLLGAKVEVRAVGGVVAVNVPPATAAGTRLRLRGMGLPGENGARGDFFVVIRHELPKDLTARQRELILQAGREGTGVVSGGAREGRAS